MTILTFQEWTRIKPLKELDIQVCSFCQKLNILNLGWKPFGKFFCRLHDKEHELCWKLCYQATRNLLGCHLYQKNQEKQKTKLETNKKHYKSQCYLCEKKLTGAGKHGTVKNRNNSTFWGLTEIFIGCLGCLKKKFYWNLEKEKRKRLNKYVRRGYE